MFSGSRLLVAAVLENNIRLTQGTPAIVHII